MQSPKAVSIGKKRPLEEEDENCEMMEHVETKRPCPLTNNSSSTTSGNLEKILNFPLPSSESVGCITKIYSEEELPLNHILEMVGILSFNTPGVSTDDEEREDFQPPSSVVPRIHCITANKWEHNNPYLSTYIGPKWNEGTLPLRKSLFCWHYQLIFKYSFILDSNLISASSSSIRDELHGLFSEFFSGDGLAADYLLCHLISRV